MYFDVFRLDLVLWTFEFSSFSLIKFVHQCMVVSTRELPNSNFGSQRTFKCRIKTSKMFIFVSEYRKIRPKSGYESMNGLRPRGCWNWQSGNVSENLNQFVFSANIAAEI